MRWEAKCSMRIQKWTAIVLVIAMVALAVIGVLIFKVGVATPQMFKKVCYFICVALIALLIVLLGYFFLLSRDKEHNYFLYDRNLGRNISPEKLRFSVVNEKMSMYISVNFENVTKLWLGNAWIQGDRFGVNGEYRALVAYKMLYDLADHDQVDEWNYFSEASEDTVTCLCDTLMRCGERNLAHKLIYIRQNCGAEIPPLRSLLLGNKKYLASKMIGLVRRNLEWFYYT